MVFSLPRVLAVSLALAVAGCGQPQQAAAPPPPTVTVAKPSQRTLTDYDEYVGRFVAVNSVEVRARVSGYLERIRFTDGQLVKQGDPLFNIDKRPFQNTLDQAKGDLAAARATLAFTEGDLERASQLVRDKTITQQTFDQRTQATKVAAGSVGAREAAVAQATLDLEFTELTAPIDGRIGDRRVSPGNLITGGASGNTTLLATIVSTDPIRVEFTFDEASYLRYDRVIRGGKDMMSSNARTPVALKLIDERDFVHEGHMDFIDNVIERASGTIRGRAVFANPKNTFTPGMFARIRIPGSEPYQALLVPDAAIGTEQIRKYVLVVSNDGTVSQKFIVQGQLVSGDQRVVKEGLNASDRVIVNGLVRARPGGKVTAQEEGAAEPKPVSAMPKSDAKTN